MNKQKMMDKLAREAYEKGCFNGVWLYAEKGKIMSKGAYGFRDAEDKLPMQEDSIFQLASITKPFTAVAIMLLIREGRLCLEDKITKFFPELTAYKDVTIQNLLTHTGGIPDVDDSTWLTDLWQEEKRIPSNSIVLRYLMESGEGPRFAPGEAFEYSNTGYCLLAEVVEKVSGVPFEAFMKEHIFEPAGMKDTGIFHIRRDGAPSDRFVRNLVLEDGKYILPGDSRSIENYFEVAEDGLNGCDFAFTTIFDMLAWDRALREETVLTLEEQRRMFTPGKLNNGEDVCYDDEDAESYGFGWAIEDDDDLGLIVSHSGGMPGLGTWFERSVDTDRAFIFANTRDYEDIRAYWSFAEGMIAVSRGQKPEPIVSIEDLTVKNPDKSNWESWCGKYEHPEDSDFIVDEVFMKDGELWAHAFDEERGELTFRLYPIGENTFGRKGGYLELTFGDGCLKYDDFTCKKR